LRHKNRYSFDAKRYYEVKSWPVAGSCTGILWRFKNDLAAKVQGVHCTHSLPAPEANLPAMNGPYRGLCIGQACGISTETIGLTIASLFSSSAGRPDIGLVESKNRMWILLAGRVPDGRGRTISFGEL
jgi:hypothetical protein